jgi:hypothetical protein
MSTAPAPSPTNAAPAAPAAGAPAHHSHLQPRDTGRFSGPPQSGQTAPPPGETPAQAAERIRLAYKENGREVVEELTPQELAEFRRQYRSREHLARESTQRLERANEMAQQARVEREAMEAQRKALLGDPRALTDFIRKNGGQGFDPLKFLTGALETVLAEREMTPEQRELAEYKRREAEREQQEQEEQERQQQEERVRTFNEEVGKKRAAWLSTLQAAIDQHGLPATEEAIDAASRHILSAMRQGVKVTPEQATEYAKAQTFHHFNGLVGGMSGDAIKKAFPAVYRAVHQHLVAQVRVTKSGQPPPAPRTAAPRPQQQDEKPQVYSTW